MSLSGAVSAGVIPSSIKCVWMVLQRTWEVCVVEKSNLNLISSNELVIHSYHICVDFVWDASSTANFIFTDVFDWWAGWSTGLWSWVNKCKLSIVSAICTTQMQLCTFLVTFLFHQLYRRIRQCTASIITTLHCINRITSLPSLVRSHSINWN